VSEKSGNINNITCLIRVTITFKKIILQTVTTFYDKGGSNPIPRSKTKKDQTDKQPVLYDWRTITNFL
jgi:hypothetical protein